MLASFFMPGGAAQSGWTSYPPLSVITATNGQTWWLIGMIFLITSSLLGSMNFIVTIIQLRAKGLGFFRLPFFVWAQFVTSFLLLLAFPPLEAAGVLQLMDKVAGTSFFLPSGLVVGNRPLDVSGGGNPLLWQHLFWFLAHPEVYVLILPAMGIVSEIIANNTRKPLWGYRVMVYAIIFLGFMSFIVWAHHMFMTGMGTTMSSFFQTTTMIISIPSVIILSALFLSLYGGSIRYNTPMLFALAFLPMFGIGGLTGLPLGLAPSDIHLHDTYYVIGHFHYVVAPGTIFALLAGIYYWFPKVTGRQMNEMLGKLHFIGSFICINGIFFPMFIQGLHGVNRRLYDGGVQYAHAQPVLHWNQFMSYAAWGLMLFQIPFIFNFFWSIWKGKPVGLESRGRPRRSSGRRRRRRRWRTATSRRSLRCSTGRTNTACPAARRTSCRRTRGIRETHGDSVYGRSPARYRTVERQARRVAVPRVGSHAVRGAVFVLHPAARRLDRMAARLGRAQRAAGVLQHGRAHHVVGDDGHGVGVAEDERLREVPAVPRR